MHGPSPSVYCNSSITALTAFVVHTEPWGRSPDSSMMPAPDISVTSALTSHSRFASSPPASRARRDRIRSRRSAGISRSAAAARRRSSAMLHDA